MSYKLSKPYTTLERADFIVKYNHNMGLKIQEVDDALYALEKNEIMQGNVPVKNSNFENEIKLERQKDFEFQFFYIENYGWFRKVPKGYSSAVEAMSAAFNMVSIVGCLPANTLTFYTEPDFTDETQCTEEWLVTNSYKNEELSTTAFGVLYAKFLEGWNEIEHKDI